MIESGLVLLAVGVMTMLLSPVERTLAHRRQVDVAVFVATMRSAFPLVPPSPALDALVGQAGAALDQLGDDAAI